MEWREQMEESLSEGILRALSCFISWRGDEDGRITEWRKTESTMMFTELQMTVLLKENFRLLQPGQRYRGTSLVLNCCYASAWMYMCLLMYEKALWSKKRLKRVLSAFWNITEDIWRQAYPSRSILHNNSHLLSRLFFSCVLSLRSTFNFDLWCLHEMQNSRSTPVDFNFFFRWEVSAKPTLCSS